MYEVVSDNRKKMDVENVLNVEQRIEKPKETVNEIKKNSNEEIRYNSSI